MGVAQVVPSPLLFVWIYAFLVWVVFQIALDWESGLFI